MKQRIKVEERHIADLWRLPCVNGLAKIHDGGILVGIGSQAKGQLALAYEGDWLIENDDHTWSVEKGGEK